MTTPLYVLPDGDTPAIPHAVKVGSMAQVRAAYASKKRSVWFAPHASGLRLLVRAVSQGRPRHGLIALERLSGARRVLFDALFAVVVEPGQGITLLPSEELREVLAATNREDLFIGVRVILEDDILVLFRGDLRSLIVPLSAFKAQRRGPKPDPARPAVTDYGQTIRLGDFEIAADALLYEFDSAARKRAKKRAVAEDPSLGAAIRRLRLQRGLSREDFPVSAKTLARIERGETTPRSATVARIAKVLGATPDELTTY
jgi:DNA-binding XRE family transcriptional regulator